MFWQTSNPFQSAFSGESFKLKFERAVRFYMLQCHRSGLIGKIYYRHLIYCICYCNTPFTFAGGAYHFWQFHWWPLGPLWHWIWMGPGCFWGTCWIGAVDYFNYYNMSRFYIICAVVEIKAMQNYPHTNFSYQEESAPKSNLKVLCHPSRGIMYSTVV